MRKLENWLHAYSLYTEGTESPPVFHLWCGLGVLAGAAQRKVYMDFDYYQIHSNMYIVLCSPRGRSRKTTALRIAKNILKAIGEYGQEVHFSTQASTVAALVSQLVMIGKSNKEHQSLTASISELGSMLGSKSTEMTDFLTDIYDCNPDWDKQTIGRGMEKIEKPWFNLMAGTTPQWLGENLSKTAVEGGFIGRAVFIYEDTRLRVAFPGLTDEQRIIQRHLVHDLAHIASLKGMFSLSPEAREFYTEWYENQDDDTDSKDIRIAGYYERKAAYVLKIAMMVSLSSNDSLVVETPDVNAALMILDDIEPGMYKAFASVGKNIYSADHERIKTQILKARENGVHYKKILGENIHAVDKQQIDRILYTLHEMGEIDRIEKTFYDKRFVHKLPKPPLSTPVKASDGT